MVKNNLSVLLSVAVLFTGSLYAPQTPTGLLAVISAATDTTPKQKKDLAVAWVMAYPDKAKGAVVSKTMEVIYGDTKGLDTAKAAAKDKENAPSATLPKDTAGSIAAVSGKSGAQAKAAVSQVAADMKKEIVKPLADALNAKEAGLAKTFFAELTADVK